MGTTDLTPAQLDALEEAAGKATSGPWKIALRERGESGEVVTHLLSPGPGVLMHANRPGEHDATYLALCDPDTIRALVCAARRCAELEKELDAIEEEREELRKDTAR